MHQRRSSFDPPLLLVGLLLPPIAAWYYFVVLDGSEASSLAYSMAKTIQFFLPLPVLESMLYQSRRFANPLDRRQAISSGVMAGVLMSLPLALFYELTLHGSELAQSVGPSIVEKMRDFGVIEPLAYLAMALFLSIIHSGLEEYYWRWFLFGRLRAYVGFWPSLIVASLGFMAHHVIVLWMFLAPLGDRAWPLLALTSAVVALAGAFWCWLYERTGRLWGPWISHIFADLALMYMGARLIWG